MLYHDTSEVGLNVHGDLIGLNYDDDIIGIDIVTF